MDLFGFEVRVRFRVHRGRVLAYGWHWGETRAEDHLTSIATYHGLPGENVTDIDREARLTSDLKSVVLEGARYTLPAFPYRNRVGLEAVLEIPHGRTRTYAEVAHSAGISYPQFLALLMKNPFQILVPCHRLVTKKGTLMGFYPLGTKVKRRLLELEGVRLGE